MILLLCSNDGSQCVKIEQPVINTVTRNSTQWHPKETGGILLGYYSDNYRLLTICKASLPPTDSKHGNNYFERGVKGIDSIIRSGKKQEPKLIYVGEWHTHPNNQPEPSPTDREQMKHFAQCRLYGASSPLLLIVGGSPLSNLKWRATVHYANEPYNVLSLLK